MQGGLDVVQGVGGLLYLVTISVVGIRLLILAWRNRGLPELLMGLAFLLSGSLGATLEVVAQTETARLGPLLTGRLVLLGKLLGGAGLALYSVFVWRVFRPDSRWAAALVCLLLAISLTALTGAAISGAFLTGVVPDGWFWLELAGRLAAPAWLMSEAILYYQRMERRVRIGLADPLVSNRFLLWASGGAIGVVILLTSVPPRLFPLGHPMVPFSVLLLAAGGVVTSVLYWLAFFPPEVYKRRIRGALAA